MSARTKCLFRPSEAGETALLLFWAGGCGTASAALEMAQLIGEKVGNMEADMRFEATPTNPQAGQKVELRATIELNGIEALCNSGAGQTTDELIEDLGEEAVERLLRKKFALKAISEIRCRT